MSQTVATFESRVRQQIRDVKTGNSAAIPFYQLWEFAELRVHEIALRRGIAETRDDAAVTLTANDHTYVLPTAGSTQHLFVRDLIHDQKNLPLGKQTVEYIQSLYIGEGTPGRGEPLLYAVEPLTDQSWSCLLWPEPSSAEAGDTLTLLSSIVPTAFGADGSQVAIPFDEPTLRGLQWVVAGDCIGAMREEDRQARGLSKGDAAEYRETGERILEATWPVLHQGKMPDRVSVSCA